MKNEKTFGCKDGALDLSHNLKLNRANPKCMLSFENEDCQRETYVISNADDLGYFARSHRYLLVYIVRNQNFGMHAV